MSSVNANLGATTESVPETGRRMSSEERREQIIAAAMAVFGARGYEGTTTDDVARTAGASQPSVVRLFRSEENRFREAGRAAREELMPGCRPERGGASSDRPVPKRIGQTYVALLTPRGL